MLLPKLYYLNIRMEVVGDDIKGKRHLLVSWKYYIFSLSILC